MKISFKILMTILVLRLFVTIEINLILNYLNLYSIQLSTHSLFLETKILAEFVLSFYADHLLNTLNIFI